MNLNTAVFNLKLLALLLIAITSTSCIYDPTVGYAPAHQQQLPYAPQHQQPQPVYRATPPASQPAYAYGAPQQAPVYTQPYQAPIAPPSGGSLDLGFKKIVTTPYNMWGARYFPMSPQQAIHHVETGVASYYWQTHENSIGEKSPPGILTAAHKTLPLPCVVKVTNLENGRSCVVRVNDRGPFRNNRIIDVNMAAAEALGFTKKGLVNSRIEVLSVGDGRLKITK